MYKAVIFDFFDVIRTDVYKAWLNKHGYKREGFFHEVADRLDHGTINVQQFLQELSDRTGQSTEEIFEEMEENAVVDQAVVELAMQLKKNYKIGLLSNAPSDFIRALMRDHDLEKHFDEIVISSEVGMAKPAPAIFELTLERMNVKPSEAIFIDDNKTNTDAAETIGIKGVVYTDVINLKSDLKELDIEYS